MDRGSRYKIEVVVALDTLGFVAIDPCGLAEASTDSGSPMDAMDAMDASRLLLRNDSCTAALSETITLSRGPEASARAARLRPAYTQRITHRRGKGQRTGAVV